MGKKEYNTAPTKFSDFWMKLGFCYTWDRMIKGYVTEERGGKNFLKMAPDRKIICDNALSLSKKPIEIIEIPKNIRCFGVRSFSSPDLSKVNYEDVTFERTALVVKDHAFDNTPKLQELSLPKTVSIGAHAFGPALTKLRFVGPPPQFDPQTFASATSLSTIIVDREYLNEYEKLFDEILPDADVEIFLNAKEREIEERKEKQKRNNERAKLDKQKEWATVRLHIRPNEYAEVRWSAGDDNHAPMVFSQRHVRSDIEVIFNDGEVLDFKDVRIYKDKEWDRLNEKIRKNLESTENVNRGKWAQWEIDADVNDKERGFFNKLIIGEGDFGFSVIAALRKNGKYHTLGENEDEEIILEYFLEVPRATFDPAKLTFFSVKGRNTHKLEQCKNLSRASKQINENYEALNEARTSFRNKAERLEDEERRNKERRKGVFKNLLEFDDHSLDTLIETHEEKKRIAKEREQMMTPKTRDVPHGEISTDDLIIWYTYLGYGNGFTTLKSLTRVNEDGEEEEI